jgi:acetate kinase
VSALGVFNAGSSSLKFALYEGERRVVSCSVEGIGAQLRASARDADGNPIEPPLARDVATAGDAVHCVLPWMNRHLAGRELAAAGHRIVHGGPDHDRPAVVTAALLGELERLVPLAPLHAPSAIAVIRAVAEADPDLTQVACFDTAFHRTNPRVAQAFAIPQALFEKGVRRYGFHGLSYEYIASVLPAVAPEIAEGRVVVAHLGNGASLCALQNRVSQASTMGFSTLSGVPMGTRPGDLDAGVILYLLQSQGYAPGDVERLLYKESGMLGLSGISSDFRELEASAEPAAAFAIDVFVYRVAIAIAGLASALGGLDGIVFSGGIGEHAASVREAICRRCAWLGVEVDRDANVANGPRITTPASRTPAYVISTDEERMIARQTAAILAS